MLVKYKKRDDHLKDLSIVFELVWIYQLRMNPFKCAFGVTYGKFHCFSVTHQRIEIYEAKVDAISKISEPQYIHELKSLQVKLAYLRRFISNLTGRLQAFTQLMKKRVLFNWDQSCTNAFKCIKSYLAKSTVLVGPITW